MEPVTAATHRFVMHGIGMRLHRSHHRHTSGRLEANDAFPVMFGAVVCLGLWIGFNAPSWSELVPVGLGITAYGVAYGWSTTCTSTAGYGCSVITGSPPSIASPRRTHSITATAVRRSGCSCRSCRAADDGGGAPTSGARVRQQLVANLRIQIGKRCLIQSAKIGSTSSARPLSRCR